MGQPLPGLLLPADGAALPARAPAAGAAAVVHARDDAAVLRPRQRVRGAARRDSGPRLLRPRASDAVHPAALGRRGRPLRRARRRLHRELVRARPAEHARHRHEHGRARRARAAGHGHPPRRAARRKRADLRHARLRDRAGAGPVPPAQDPLQPGDRRPPAVPVRSGQRDVPLLPAVHRTPRPRDPGGGRLAVRRRAVLRAGALRGHVRVRRRQRRARHPRPALLRPHQAVLERRAAIAPVRLHLCSASRTPWAAPCSPTSVACGPTSPRTPSSTGRASASSTASAAGCASSRGRRS